MTSLLDGDPKKHVKDFKCELVVYSKKIPLGKTSVDASTLPTIRNPIKLANLFVGLPETLERGGAEVERVLLFGNPGTGKTSISKKLAYDWAEGRWGSQFQVVYVVPLHSIKKSFSDPRKMSNPETVITNLCFDLEDPSRSDAIKTQVKDDLTKKSTLVVIDGLDEADEMGRKMASRVWSRGARTLILSRPSNFDFDYDREVELLGLSDEQLVDFVMAETGSEIGSKFLNELQANANVWEIAHVPVTAQLLCTLRKNNGGELNPRASATLYGLYSEVTIFVWNRYLEHRATLNARKEEVFDVLGRIAIGALKDGQVFIDAHTVREHFSSMNVKTFLADGGFLLLSREGNKYRFPHLTFQEFFAGRYLGLKWRDGAKDEKEEARRFLKDNKYSQSLRFTLSFAMECACGRNDVRGFRGLLALFDESPVEILGVQHLFLQLRLIEALLGSNQESSRVFENAGSVERIIRRATKLAEVMVPFSQYSPCQQQWKNVLAEFERNPRTIERFQTIYKAFLETAGHDVVTNDCSLIPITVSRLTKKIPTLTSTLMRVLSELSASENEDSRSTAMYWIRGVVEARPEVCDRVLHYVRAGCVDESAQVRFASMFALAEVGNAMPEIRSEVIELLENGRRDKNDWIRIAAMRGLGRLSSADSEFFKELSSTMRSAFAKGNRRTRIFLVRSAESFPIRHDGIRREVMTLLRAACSDENATVRATAVSVLPNIATQHHELSEEVVLLSEAGLEDACIFVRISSMVTIQKLAMSSVDLANRVRATIGRASREETHQSSTSAVSRIPKSLEHVIKSVPGSPSLASAQFILTSLHDTALTITRENRITKPGTLTIKLHGLSQETVSTWEMQEEDVKTLMTYIKEALDWCNIADRAMYLHFDDYYLSFDGEE